MRKGLCPGYGSDEMHEDEQWWNDWRRYTIVFDDTVFEGTYGIEDFCHNMVVCSFFRLFISFSVTCIMF